jgi:citronellol/citronellal dehydrogenase
MSYRTIFRPGLFTGQTVVVTGGGSGIGRCTAHELAALGAHAVIVGRSVDKLATVVAEIREDGGEASHVACDIRDEEAVKAAVSVKLSMPARAAPLWPMPGMPCHMSASMLTIAPPCSRMHCV